MIIERMSVDLALPSSFIEALARGASHEYKMYSIPKRTGGQRTIHHPSKRLKGLQRWLLVNVVSQLPVHPAAAAYRPGKSIFDNALRHASSRYLLRMDFEEFFPSIQVTDLTRYIADHQHLFADWSALDIEVFSKLMFRHGALTIGAPTSPAVSNALCFELDSALDALAASSSVTYSRYADDLFFSTVHPNVLGTFEARVATVVKSLRTPDALKLNPLKTRHSSKKGRRRVTGIVLGSDGHAYIGRARKREIRAMIQRYPSLNDTQKAYLAGMIAFAVGLDPEFMNHLISKYGLARVREAMHKL